MSFGGQSILVMGAGGFIGSNLLSRLKTETCTVRAFDRKAPAQASGSTPADWRCGELADIGALAGAMDGCEAVVCLASSSLPGTANANLGAEIHSHVETTVRAAELALACGVKRFIFASSGGTIYGANSAAPLREDDRTAPRNAYGVSKLAIEHYLRLLTELRGLKTVSLRISNPFGEAQRADRPQGFVSAALLAALKGTPLSIWGDGTAVRDFIYVGDVAEAIFRACSYDGTETVINIGSGHGRSLAEVISAVENATGRAILVEYQAARPIDVPVSVLNIERASRELGWRPQTDFPAALKRTSDWFTEHGLVTS